MQFAPGSAVRLEGLLGDALSASLAGHLRKFIRDETSPPIALWDPARVQHNHEGDWYGEHAGKWLVAAARAVERTGDTALTENLRRVAGYLVGRQEPDGYLGTYAPERRFMRPQPSGPLTWDGAPGQRTWDIWVHSYLILGLLEVGRVLAARECVAAAVKIGDLCARTITEAGIKITALGNHHGLSATVLLDPAVELFLQTGEKRFLHLAEEILRQASEAPSLAFLPQLLAGTDPAFIATGKAYQLCWNLVGLAKLHRATKESRYLDAVRRAWDAIRRHHLTRGGGPWGGVAHRSREVFNPPGVFSPYGYVETCSTFSWIQLNRELLAITGEAAFADEIEKSAYNDLLGAQAPGGDNWCYYSFPNGRRVFTTYWRCCKSSGPWGLEELPSVAYAHGTNGAVVVNLYGASTGSIETAGGRVEVQQKTKYPFTGAIRLEIRLERNAKFPLHLRVPSWAKSCAVHINGAGGVRQVAPNTYLEIEREWRAGDVVELKFEMPPVLHRATNRNVQESRAPDGSPVTQQVLNFDYLAITRGPLVYATDLIDGFKIEETVRLPKAPDASMMEVVPGETENVPPMIRLNLGYREPITFAPYFLAGGRADQTWRLTWMQLAPT